MSTPLVTVDDLHVTFSNGSTVTEAVKGISFTIEPGECVAIVGESGSGKSVTARTLVGLAGPGSKVEATTLEAFGDDLLRFRERDWRRLRGKEIGFILQDALVSLDPLRTVGKEVAELLIHHRIVPRRQVREKVEELLASAGIPDPEVRADQRAHELSGGLRQRALIASAIGGDPQLIIADEPTTALDVTVQDQILDLLERLCRQGTALLLVSHDLAVVARLADRVFVMRNGVFVDEGPTQEVLRSPTHAYTRQLLDAVPSANLKGERLSDEPPVEVASTASATVARRRVDQAVPEIVLQASGLVKSFPSPDGSRRVAVDHVSFTLRRGSSLGIVGESGSGKTTVARLVLGLADPDEGEVLLHGQPWSNVREKSRRPLRTEIQVISQDPLGSFDPRYDVQRLIGEALAASGQKGPAARDNAVRLLENVGLDSTFLKRSPLQLSGGQRQRVAIARALASEPSVIVCDEPVSALDISIQAQVLDLLNDLKQQLGVSLLFISHDLGVVYHVSDEVLVMKDGRVVESGAVDDVFDEPGHPYTRALLEAMPRLTEPATRPA